MVNFNPNKPIPFRIVSGAQRARLFRMRALLTRRVGHALTAEDVTAIRSLYREVKALRALLNASTPL